MSDVKQTIQVTNAGLSPILSIAQGTGMVDFEFTISDFQIPAGSTAVAHNIQPTGNIVSQVCTLVGNVITVTPPAYYFLRGKNYMQIQVTGADGVNLFTFLIEVWCSPNISAPAVSQNPDLISQLMSMIGNTQDLDTTAKNNLVAAINEIYSRGEPLDTLEEIDANTDEGKAAGALAVKTLDGNLKANGNRFIYDYQNGQYGYNTDPARGADTFHPFNNGATPLVPILSSDNNNVISDTVNPSFPGWHAFNTSLMTPAIGGTYYGYNFEKKTLVNFVEWIGYNQNYPGFSGNVYVQGSDDNFEWETVHAFSGSRDYSVVHIEQFENDKSFMFWRLKSDSSSGISYLQFFGN